MKEYREHLEFYREYGQSLFSNMIQADRWGDEKAAEKFLDAFWLPEIEYNEIWKPIQGMVFPKMDRFPMIEFNPDFQLLNTVGGCLFAESDFEALQKVLVALGETHFVVIQNTQDFTSGEPMFRMKFPVGITWEQMTAGNYISAVLLEMNYNEYFVFGNLGVWGKYSATDFSLPVDIYGFQPGASSLFVEAFGQERLDEAAENSLPEELRTTKVFARD